jgi:hypothetical protein
MAGNGIVRLEDRINVLADNSFFVALTVSVLLEQCGGCAGVYSGTYWIESLIFLSIITFQATTLILRVKYELQGGSSAHTFNTAFASVLITTGELKPPTLNALRSEASDVARCERLPVSIATSTSLTRNCECTTEYVC